MKEEEIKAFIDETEADLALAKSFLAMWQRRHGAGSYVTRASLQHEPSHDHGSNGSKSKDEPESDSESSEGYGAVRRLILHAIESCPNDYTIHDVKAALKTNGNDMPITSVSQAVSRLARNREITPYRPGKGRAPTIYRK